MQTRIDQAKKTARFQFDSLGELAGWIKDTPRLWPSRDGYTQAQDARQAATWDLNAGYASAVDMARNGWVEGAQRVQDALATFPSKTPVPDTRTDVYGFRPHVPRFCAGAPDSMIRHTNVAEAGSGRVLTLAVALDANAGTNAAHMANFGVAVAQYVNQLETDGVRVELIGVLVGHFKMSGWRTVQSFTVKNADQPLDLAVVAFAIGHPAMLRRIGFAALERMPVPPADNYGSAVDARPSDIINAPPGTVILNGMKDAGTNAPTPQKGFEYVAKMIEAALEQQEL